MRTRTFTWEDPEALAAAARDGRTGLGFLQAIAAGELPAPPIGRMLGMDILEVAEGRAVFSLEPTEWMFNPIGSVHGGKIGRAACRGRGSAEAGTRGSGE